MGWVKTKCGDGPRDGPGEESSAARRDLRACLDAARQGDIEARGALIARFEPLFARAARRCLGRQRFLSEGEDLLQTIRLSALASMDSLRRWDLPAVAAWLKRLVHSRLIDWERSRKDAAGQKRVGSRRIKRLATGMPGPPAPEPSPSGALIKGEEAARLRAAIDEVPERYRAVLRQIVNEDPSAGEIAVFLGKGSEAARKFTAQALKHLRIALRRRGGVKTSRGRSD